MMIVLVYVSTTVDPVLDLPKDGLGNCLVRQNSKGEKVGEIYVYFFIVPSILWPLNRHAQKQG